MIQKFQEAGYEIVDFNEKADIYIVNTCTVTNMSDRKSRQILRRAKELNENAIVVAVGCYVQVAKNEIDKIPEIDFTLGTNEKVNIVENVENFLKNGNEISIDDVLHNSKYGDFGDGCPASSTTNSSFAAAGIFSIVELKRASTS